MCYSSRPIPENLVATSSSALDILPVMPHIHDERVNCEIDSNPDSPQLPDLCD